MNDSTELDVSRLRKFQRRPLRESSFDAAPTLPKIGVAEHPSLERPWLASDIFAHHRRRSCR